MVKLVRDKIPEIIKSNGENPIYHTATDEEYAVELCKKLVEESTEFAEADTECKQKEELADVVEVLFATLTFYKFDFQKIEELRIMRRINKIKEKIDNSNPEIYTKLRLLEKAGQVYKSQNLTAKQEFIADTIDTLFDILRIKNFTLDEIEQLMNTKRQKNGWFTLKIILDGVE